MPVYNEQKYLKESIESILNQSFKDFEFIIIDDGSEDESVEVINSYSDSRIRFFKSEKKGIPNQLNFGIRNSNASLIARMDADDIANENRFEIQLRIISEHPEIDVIGSNILLLDENGTLICEKKYPELHEDIEFMMPVESAVCHPSVIMQKQVLEKNGMYNNNFQDAEDHELFLRLIYKGYKFYNVQDALLKYRLKHFRTESSRRQNSNRLSYKIGIDYLTRTNSESVKIGSNYDYYRLGLIEYYRGSIPLSRKYFINALISSENSLFKIIRYVVLTLFGQKLIDYLRKSNILPKFSLYVNKIISIDFHRIRK